MTPTTPQTQPKLELTLPKRGWFEVEEESYKALSEGVALVDRSARGKLALSGLDAVDFLHGQVTNDILGLAPGSGCYAAFLTPKGMMVGDLRALAVGRQEAEEPCDHDRPVGELLLDTELHTLQALFDMVRRYKVGYRLELHKRTLQRGLLRLAGPQARALLGEIGDGLAELPEAEHSHRLGNLAGAAVRAIACERGEVELLFAAEEKEPLTKALLAAGARAVDEEAFEVVRVERGIPRYGLEMDDRTIPQEAGLNERAVSFTKGCYVGQETVARLYYKGKPNRHLRGLRLERPAPIGTPVFRGDQQVGKLGSVAVSPRFGAIALAVLRRECLLGERVSVGGAQGGVEAVVCDPTFAASGAEGRA